MNFEQLRHEYMLSGLDEKDAARDPFRQFDNWFKASADAKLPLANSMSLATATLAGRISIRAVLLKAVDTGGFTFYTNFESRKARNLAENPHAALLFCWDELERQVRIEGSIERVSDAESDAYYATRPRISRLGAWASDQSRPLRVRADLEARLADQEKKYPSDDIPRPAHWGGYRLLPERFEFWQNMPFRLHDRTIYTARPGGGWATGKLFP